MDGANTLEVNEPADLSVVGLAVEDSAAGRICMFAILCSELGLARLDLRNPQALSYSRVLSPGLAVRKSLEMTARLREPIVGELFHFARQLPGGVPIRKNEWVQDETFPAVLVTKKVTSQDWPNSISKAKLWVDQSTSVFSKLVVGAAMDESLLLRYPGDVQEPELVAFKNFAVSLANDLKAKRCFLDKSPSVDLLHFKKRHGF